MLILSRHKNEKLMIGDDITITVVEVRGDKVRLGIDAPSHIPVHRQEVYDAIETTGCPECNGTGGGGAYVAGGEIVGPVGCQACDGTGVVQKPRKAIPE